MQREFFDLLPRKREEALKVSEAALRYLREMTERFPEDSYLRVTRGYLYKNLALALRSLDRDAEMERALTEADRVFEDIVRESPGDASAWNGRGSVAATRGDFENALQFIEKALEIDPKYEAALHDREIVRKYMQGAQAG